MSTASRSSFDSAAHRRRRTRKAMTRLKAIPSAKALELPRPTDGEGTGLRFADRVASSSGLDLEGAASIAALRVRCGRAGGLWPIEYSPPEDITRVAVLRGRAVRPPRPAARPTDLVGLSGDDSG